MNDLETGLRSLRDTQPAAPPDLADRALGRAHRRKTRRRAVAVAGTAVAAVAVVVAGVNAATTKLAAPAPASQTSPLKPRENVLIIGTDGGPGRTGARPDTIVLASIDTRSGDTTLLGFPRNLGHVPFPPGSGGADRWPDGFWCVNATTGLNDCLLNAVWAWAESDEGRQFYPGRQPGLDATRDAVEQISGQQVTQSVVLSTTGLQQLVDAVGGVRVDVKERLPIGGSATDPVAAGGWIEKGDDRLLDGYHAVWYARSRWSTSDYDRMRRQQCLLSAIAAQVDARTLARNWPELAPVLRANVRTSLDPADLRLWVALAESVRAGRLRMLPFTDQVIADRDNPDYAQLRRLAGAALERDGQATPAASGDLIRVTREPTC